MFSFQPKDNLPSHSSEDNICCPRLQIYECGEDKDHCHFVCGDEETLISGNTLREVCSTMDYEKCVQFFGGVDDAG